MTRKSVPRQKREDRPHAVSSANNQQAVDGVRAKLHDRRRRHQQQHGEAGRRQLGATNIMAVAGVVAVLGVAAYYWYISVIRDIVRTPLQAPRFVDPALPAAQQDMQRFWGSYRSGLYFGMKTRSPRSPVVGKTNCALDHFMHQRRLVEWLVHFWLSYTKTKKGAVFRTTVNMTLKPVADVVCFRNIRASYLCHPSRPRGNSEFVFLLACRQLSLGFTPDLTAVIDLVGGCY